MKFKAIIIETRNVENLVSIIKDRHLKYLPLKYDLHIFVYKDNKHLVENIDFGRNTKITTLKNNITSIQDYNFLITHKDFWNYLKCDKVLIFQTDSELLRNGIEDFEEWNWVGAPWPNDSGWSKNIPWIYGSNGGLSLRSVNKMKEITDKIPWNGMNEDMYFLNGLYNTGIKLTPRNIQLKFSIETVYNLGSLGYHAIDRHLSKEQCKKIKEQYIKG